MTFIRLIICRTKDDWTHTNLSKCEIAYTYVMHHETNLIIQMRSNTKHVRTENSDNVAMIKWMHKINWQCLLQPMQLNKYLLNISFASCKHKTMFLVDWNKRKQLTKSKAQEKVLYFKNETKRHFEFIFSFNQLANFWLNVYESSLNNLEINKKWYQHQL